MDEIIRRLRTEPALVMGILTTIVTFVMALATGGGTLVTLLPALVGAIVRQFVTPAVKVITSTDDLPEVGDWGPVEP